MAQAAAQAVADANRIKRATDLPPFFGAPSKDVIGARQLIDRMTHAARVAHWNDDASKCDNFYLLLRDRALIWWEQLVYEGVDVANWETVKREFLSTYEPKYTAKTTCANFADLTQRSGETVNDYYLRICEAMARICEAKPAAMTTVRTAVLIANPPAANDNDRETIKREGILDAEKFFRHQLFLAGLAHHLRSKVMEANKNTLRESVALAIELETIHGRPGARTTVAAVQQEEDLGEMAGIRDDIEDDELAAINAIRQRKGKAPFRRPFRSGFNGQAGSQPVMGNCRYCKKPGHHQKKCRARIAARAPMVDKDGKPFRQNVSVVSETGTINDNAPPGPTTTPMHNETSVGSIMANAFSSLNW